jgi:hypothetical protein
VYVRRYVLSLASSWASWWAKCGWMERTCSGCRVLMCGRCVLLMVWRLSSRVPCGRSGFSPCCVLCATHDRNVPAHALVNQLVTVILAFKLKFCTQFLSLQSVLRKLGLKFNITFYIQVPIANNVPHNTFIKFLNFILFYWSIILVNNRHCIKFSQRQRKLLDRSIPINNSNISFVV